MKLNENIGASGIALLRQAGHDVRTVNDQGLSGTSDQNFFDVCRRESRALVTLDHDFGNILRFPPHESAGVVVLELGPRPGLSALLERVQELCRMLEATELSGELWIIEPGRVRIHVREE